MRRASRARPRPRRRTRATRGRSSRGAPERPSRPKGGSRSRPISRPRPATRPDRATERPRRAPLEGMKAALPGFERGRRIDGRATRAAAAALESGNKLRGRTPPTPRADRARLRGRRAPRRSMLQKHAAIGGKPRCPPIASAGSTSARASAIAVPFLRTLAQPPARVPPTSAPGDVTGLETRAPLSCRRPECLARRALSLC